MISSPSDFPRNSCLSSSLGQWYSHSWQSSRRNTSHLDIACSVCFMPPGLTRAKQDSTSFLEDASLTSAFFMDRSSASACFRVQRAHTGCCIESFGTSLIWVFIMVSVLPSSPADESQPSLPELCACGLLEELFCCCSSCSGSRCNRSGAESESWARRSHLSSDGRFPNDPGQVASGPPLPHMWG